MMRARTWRWGAVFALALAVGAAVGETRTLTPAQMRILASESVLKGLPQQGFDLSTALLARDPDDIDALLILSRAARDLGKLDAAKDAAQRAWSLAERPEHRHAAALAQAQALSSMGNKTRAQLWLRRAVHLSPTEHDRALAIRDFRYVRSRDPWSTQLRFNIAPSDNVNNGSVADTSELFGLPLEFELSGAARALSGTEIAYGFATRYRLRDTPQAQFDLLFGLRHTTYLLSEDAKDKAPDVSGSDFATTVANVGLRHSGIITGTRLSYSVEGELGRTWYAGDPYLDSFRTSGTLNVATTQRSMASFTLAHDWQQGLTGREDSQTKTARVSFVQGFNNGNRLLWSVGVDVSSSDADYLDYTRQSASARLVLGKPVLGTTVTFGVSAAQKKHDFSGLTGGTRAETTLGADMTVTFNQLEVMGFVPSLRLQSSRTDGDIDLLDKGDTGIGFGIRSAF